MKGLSLRFRVVAGFAALVLVPVIFLGSALCSAWTWWHFGPSWKLGKFLCHEFGTLRETMTWFRQLRSRR